MGYVSLRWRVACVHVLKIVYRWNLTEELLMRCVDGLSVNGSLKAGQGVIWSMKHVGLWRLSET